jgi:hypothetical protein
MGRCHSGAIKVEMTEMVKNGHLQRVYYEQLKTKSNQVKVVAVKVKTA